VKISAKNSDFNKARQKISLDYQMVVIFLITVIAAMLVVWKPWAATSNNGRTIEVTGESTVTATPDKFVFYPSYQFTNASKNEAIKAMNAKSNEITTELEKLGVPEKDIKTNSSGYETLPYKPESGEQTPTYNLQMTIITDSQAQAQKVQNYLETTALTGSVSPQAAFSDSKRKKLESQARDKATKDARAKADQTASNLGFKIGKVKSVSDGSGPVSTPLMDGRSAASSEIALDSSAAIHPGENDLPYSVTVVYFIK
jgi:uncharacterized protein YggE